MDIAESMAYNRPLEGQENDEHHGALWNYTQGQI